MIALGGGMRPIYQLPKAGQIVSLGIASRWAFEADLVHEAEAAGWGRLRPFPDVTCTLGVVAPALPGKPIAGPAIVGATAPGPPSSLSIVSDAAEGSVPKYVITAKNADGDEETCRAAKGQGFPLEHPTAYALKNRRPFGQSMAVLGGMMVALAVMAIGILKKRDSEPQ
jgi:hypothetical protein